MVTCLSVLYVYGGHMMVTCPFCCSNYAAVCGVAVISDSCISNGLVCVASNGKCIVHLLQ